MLLFSRTGFFTSIRREARSSSLQAQCCCWEQRACSTPTASAIPWESRINPFLWVRLSPRPTAHHCKHLALCSRSRSPGATALLWWAWALLCWAAFSPGKRERALLFTRKGAGLALYTWEQRNGPQLKPSLNSWHQRAEAGLAWHGGAPSILSRVWKLENAEHSYCVSLNDAHSAVHLLNILSLLINRRIFNS